ncbi:MAG: AMP-dependent synthetase [Citromicrobium sp.]|nr:AMP-dependent synthetase [Citromicrobium sp.]MAO96811.1 AMP-dependent synthetase [Citromicrobium sp.]MAS84584.1 AMP-dependent synthetase [Erythrobacteraceae bacterium]MBD77103.1 AMP-dependent synthetase [Citromicrobium sp.]MBT47620.1 AMP-dependent synthetase [Citromicrobium sp.]|tara:strand:+ start:12673 stop:14256 length:1584 start_codon:yes stop_codon:yes gene_type:complete
MIPGAMQPYSLTVDKFLDHAAKWHSRSQVVTATGAGDSTRTDYLALRAQAQRVSAALAERGAGQGDVVATLAWNTQEHLESWYGIMGMGAICHTLNPRLLPTQLAAMLGESGARLLILSADLQPLASDVLALGTAIKEVLLIDNGLSAGQIAGDTFKAGTLADATRQATREVEWGRFDEDAPCGLCFTSGTTGAPKGVTYTHRGNYLHTLRQLQADVAGLTGEDAILTMVPMFHANAWGLPFSVPAVGGKLVLPGRHADGATLARLIVEEQVTLGVGVPTVWLGLMDHLDQTGEDLPSLRRIMVGGAAMSPSLMERIERRGIRVQTTWGMTEISPLGTAMPPAAGTRSPSASGRPAIGIDLMLTDASGKALDRQRGAEGHLWVRGPSVVERYLGQAEPVTQDGWFDTGDLARIDESGILTITGRAKDLIKSGGEWINPAEIEAIVGAHPDVSQAAVIGREHAKWGERPVLLVELRDGAEIGDEALLDTLDGKVASWWRPDSVLRLANMPLAATGKIDKLRLRSEYGR